METQINNLANKPKFNIAFFFLSLGVLISLITSVVSFLNLAFATLDKRFPDVLNSTYQYGYYSENYEGIRIALATLIIFFPVFLILFYFWNKHIKNILGIIDEIIKKWLIYIIIFLSSLVSIIDLVVLIKYFLSGEITNRFIFKVLITLIIALFSGIYFLFKLKGKEKIFRIFKIDLWAMIKSIIFVILIIIFAFSVMGSPKTQRLLRLDQKRLNDLQNIQYQVINYWQQKEKLPENLKDLSNPLTGYSLPTPPNFDKGEIYEYFVIKEKELTFSLCGTFELPIEKGWQEYNYGGGIPMYDMKVSSDVALPYPGGVNESWNHEIGRTCFERTIDKDIYPPFEKRK